MLPSTVEWGHTKWINFHLGQKQQKGVSLQASKRLWSLTCISPLNKHFPQHLRSYHRPDTLLRINRPEPLNPTTTGVKLRNKNVDILSYSNKEGFERFLIKIWGFWELFEWKLRNFKRIQRIAKHVGIFRQTNVDPNKVDIAVAIVQNVNWHQSKNLLMVKGTVN